MSPARRPLSLKSILKFVAIWALVIPFLAIGGLAPRPNGPPGYPLGDIVNLAGFALLEIAYLYGAVRVRRLWFKGLLLLIYGLSGLGWCVRARAMLEGGGLLMAHGLWLITSLVLALAVSIHEYLQQRASE